ncbi:serine hydrolase domain-containing protein [Pediococcus stilesii]|uniref:serine hydrolase domain-containing protein n=1 Tax=Pediococcus stilesii TaxID=331679 RepID=UPI000A8D5B42|nr:serine hydrolase domain-containing protein [Pediococcus stilesii]
MVVLRKSYWFWIILILQVCFILKMVHDTYLNDMWATHYTINPHSDLIANVDYMLKDNKFSGTALVVKDHQVLLHKGYGKSDDRSSNSVNTLYNIASIEKSMTSVMVAKLIQEGELTYATRLSKFYPEVPNAKNISIRNMLTMTSGLATIKDPSSSLTEQQLTKFYLKNVEADPRKGWNYDAINFHLLVGIITKITHKNYIQSFNRLVNPKGKFEVMEMPNFNNSNIALSFKKNGRKYSNAQYIYTSEVGTGSFFMTAGGLFRYFEALINGKILPKRSVKTLLETTKDSVYTAGVYQNKLYYRGHGILQGYEPSIMFNQTAGNTVILLGNRKGAKTTMKLTNSIYALINQTPYLGGNSY